ncbi:uncharacterized protein LOC100178376 isoform X2 [Ciona intestinalis]
MAPGFSFFKRLRTKSKSKRSVPSPSSFSTKDTVLSCTPSETSRFINDKYANGDAYGNAPIGNVKADLLGNESREQPQCVSKISPTISVNAGITSREIMPDKMTNLEIPTFWPSSVRLWFDTIERVFDSNQVFSECVRFTHAVSGLGLEQIDKVSHVVLNGDVDFPYSNLKSALLKFYEPTEVERLPKPFDVTQSNTHKPTEMSSEMKPSLSSHGDDCDVTENLLNKLCVDRLPEEVNHTLCLEYAQSDIETLACKADSIMMLNLPNSVSNLSSTITDVSNAHETPSPTRISFQASVNDNLRIHQLIDERNSIKNASSQCVIPPCNLGFYTSDDAHQRGDVNFPPRNNAWRTRCFNQLSFCRRRKRRNRRFSPSQFCFYHTKYGYRAHKCTQPCSWHNVSRKRVKYSTCAVSRGNWTSYTPSTFNVFDNRLNLSFLCDSGGAVSIIPLWFVPRFSRRKSMRLQDVSGKTFSSFGQIKLVLNLNMGRSFVWTFKICDIEHAILGADFFNHYRILLDVSGKRLIPHHNFPDKRLASAKRTKRRKSESHSKPEMKPEDNITTSTTTQPDAHNIVLTTSPTTTTTTNTNPTNISSTPTKIFPKNENPNNSFKSLSVPTSHSCSNLPSTSISPIKTSPTSDLSCFPVPLSFIERFQSQLFTHTSPKSGEKLDDSKVAIQICEKCPHCVAMANEIKYLLSVAANAGFGTSFTNKSSSNDHMLKVIGICGQDNIKESSHTLNSQPVLLTKQYYYKRLSTEQSTCTLKMEQDNFRDDGTMLNIPTWRVKVISLEDTSTESPIEAIDDESYLKRHSKFEIAEKRRKRWDIQRIREYRYNEKLRQKILKQDLNKDGSVETFSPSLFEIDALAVDNCLPVNVFGHCLPHLPVQEFSLSSSR